MDDDDESVKLAFGAMADTRVGAGTTSETTVSITDDDQASILCDTSARRTSPWPRETPRGRATRWRWPHSPSDSVSVSITGHDGTDLSLSGPTLSSDTLTFTVDDWATAQTVTVKAGQDDDTVGDTATLTHTASGGDYTGITADLPVTVTDNDTASIVLSEPGLTVTEGDPAGSSYTVKLATKPSSSVSVSITGHDGTDLSLDKTSLTFTTDDWDDAQTVTVTAEEDDDAVTDTVATLTHTASGGDYANLTADLPVTVTDNDTPAIVFSETRLAVTEGDAVGMSYTVALATQPSASVSVSITGHAGTDLTLSSDTLTFTVNDWDDAQTVTVKAGQDDDAVNDAATLTHTASGGDYANLTSRPPRDGHRRRHAGNRAQRDGSRRDGGRRRGDELHGGAGHPALGSVSVSITGHSGTDLTLSSDTLTFTVNDWDDAQTVTVKAGQDDDTVNDTATLTHTASGGDYANLTADLP